MLDVLFSQEPDIAHIGQGLLDGRVETSLCDSGVVQKLAACFAASDHLRVEDVGLDVGVVLEDVVAVHHHQGL